MYQIKSAIGVFVFALLAMTLASSACGQTAARIPGTDVLRDFTILSAARSDISLGAPWQQGLGPTTSGVSNDKLLTVSGIDSEALQRDSNLNASLVAAVAQKLNLSAGGSRNIVDDVKLNKVTIVRVKDLSSLGAINGAAYVWEGVQVESFSVKTDRKTAENAKVDLPKAIPNATVSASFDNSGTGHIEVNGGNLFVAYRVVEFSEGRLFSKAVKFPGLNSTAELPLNYQLQARWANLSDSHAYENRDDSVASPIWPEPHPTDEAFRCRVHMSVTNFNVLRGGNPVQERWLISCLNNQNVNGTYALNSSATAEGVELDSVVLQDVETVPVQASPETPGIMLKGGKIVVQRRTFKASTLPKPKAPGWNEM